jgi:hypothetical protein
MLAAQTFYSGYCRGRIILGEVRNGYALLTRGLDGA